MLNSEQGDRLRTWGPLALLLAIVALAWCAGNDRWSPASWGVPTAYLEPDKGDVVHALAMMKAAGDGEFVPLAWKKVEALGAPNTANWNDWPFVEELLVAQVPACDPGGAAGVLDPDGGVAERTFLVDDFQVNGLIALVAQDAEIAVELGPRVAPAGLPGAGVLEPEGGEAGGALLAVDLEVVRAVTVALVGGHVAREGRLRHAPRRAPGERGGLVEDRGWRSRAGLRD